ncbi:Murein DD-endopeptidase MepM [Arthrobacter saudimassiliensis]|uniref:Murein DD-endopeptidase MepM n=1 Tax=Arthrobacter saudimassiliensis TaxID=1461584 RepID=A0A078MSC5_9MICC|nr:Murein DD-endopeptidase MepM [Arthrobacter saudimassiliensis]
MTRNHTFFSPSTSLDALHAVGSAIESEADAVRETSRAAAGQVQLRSRRARRRALHWAAGSRGAGLPAGLQRRLGEGTRRLAILGGAAAVALGAVVAGTASAAQQPLPLMRAVSVESLDQADDGGEAPDGTAGNGAGDAGGDAGGTGSTQPLEAPAAEPAPEPAAEADAPRPNVPLDTMEITSNFGWRNIFGSEFHTGTDFSAVTGTPVKAARAGTVVYAHWHYEGGGGLRIVIDHGDGFTSTYNHLSAIDVSEGQWVDFNQHIGAVGSTGNSTGPHLHFEVLRDGDYVDPMAWLAA